MSRLWKTRLSLETKVGAETFFVRHDPAWNGKWEASVGISFGPYWSSRAERGDSAADALANLRKRLAEEGSALLDMIALLPTELPETEP